MSTQLESARYFTPENNPFATPEVDDASGRISQAALRHDGFTPLWSPFLSGICVICSIFGVWAIFGGILSAWSLFTVETIVDGIDDSYLQGQNMKAAIEAQTRYIPFAAAIQAFRILLGFALLGAAALLRSKNDGANKAAALVFAGCILFDLVQLAYSALSVDAVLSATPMAEEIKSTAFLFAVGVGAVLFLVQTAFYTGLIAYLSSKGVRAMFRPQEKSIGSLAASAV